MKKTIAIILAASMLFGCALGVTATTISGSSSTDINVYFNGNKLVTPVSPINKDNRVFVPFRAIFQALGYSVEYENATKIIYATNGTNEMTLSINSKNAVVNDVNKEIDVAPFITEGSTMVPIRFVSENSGATVNYDGSSKTVTVVKKEANNPNNPTMGDGFTGTVSGQIMTGEVNYLYPDGSTYVGTIKDGYFNGKGKYATNNGTSYDGMWVMGKMTGDGKLFYNSGDKFVGTFNDGALVEGTYYYSDGSTYIGSFKNDLPHGEGTYIDKDGNKYSGTFNNGYLVI